jgi:hypothetical protein
MGDPARRTVTVEIGLGELIDKITILQIKADRIQQAEKLANVHAELAQLQLVHAASVMPSEALAKLTALLKQVNEALWQIEDEIRACERAGAFGARFIALARSVYRQNDRRADLKRQINELLGSALVEEKSYAAYDQDLAAQQPERGDGAGR